MKGQTYVILTIVFGIIIAIFAVINVESVEVNYIFFKRESPLILLILFSVLMGGVLTMIAGSVKYFNLKRENKQLIQKIERLTNQLGHDMKDFDSTIKETNSKNIDET